MISKLKSKLQNSSKNSKQLFKNVVMSFGVKGLSIFVGMMILPVYLKYFSNESALGVWLTIISLANWVFTFDLGLGNGLRNKLTESATLGKYDDAKKYVSSTYLMASVISITAVALFLIAQQYIDWNSVLNISAEDLNPQTLKTAITILFAGTMLQFVLKLINTMFTALQKPAVPSMVMLVANLCLLLFLYFAKPESLEKNIFTLSYSYVIIVNTPLLLISIIMFAGAFKKYAPSIKHFSKNHLSGVTKLGLSFFFLQLMALFLYGVNNYLISKLIDPASVVTYQAYFKLINLVSTLFMMAMGATWSAITEAYAQKKYKWIMTLKNTLYKTLSIAVLGYVIIFITIGWFMPLWMGKTYSQISYSLVLIMFFRDFLLIWCAITSNVANGMGKLKASYILMSFSAIINIPLAFFLCEIFGNKTEFIILANILAMLPFCIGETISSHLFINKRISEIANA